MRNMVNVLEFEREGDRRIVSRCAFMIVCLLGFLALSGCASFAVGRMLPGTITAYDGVVWEMQIQIAYSSGLMVATNPMTKEKLQGNYYSVSGGAGEAPVTAVLSGDAGTVLNCDLMINASQFTSQIHGHGTATDNRGRKYAIEF